MARPKINKKSLAVSKRLRTRKQPKRLELKRLIRAYIALITFTALLAIVIGISYNHNKAPVIRDPFSVTQRQAADFTLYYPARLPKTYAIDSASLDQLQQGIIHFRVTTDSGMSVTINEQKAPQNFNFTTLYNTFSDRTDFKTDQGQATSGTIDDGHTYLTSLVTPKQTWILVNAKSAVPQQDLRNIFAHLRASE